MEGSAKPMIGGEIDELAGASAMQTSMWDELAAIPHRRDWFDLREAFAAAVRASFSDWIRPGQPHFERQLAFALGRFDEGAGLVHYFAKCPPRPGPDGGLHILDIGAGNGGVAFALANCRGHWVQTLDLVPNPALLRLKRSLGIPVRPVIGAGQSLPFAPGTMDIVLLLDMLEHVAAPDRLGQEVTRVLRSGGVCMITTPPRLQYLLARDPHYGIRGLLLFPNAVQRQIVNRFFRRTIGAAGTAEIGAYDVEHTFWTAAEIARLFPGPKRVDALYNHPLEGAAPRFSKEWWRYRYRHLHWDRLLIYKEDPPTAPTQGQRGPY